MRPWNITGTRATSRLIGEKRHVKILGIVLETGSSYKKMHTEHPARVTVVTYYHDDNDVVVYVMYVMLALRRV
jgi:hypothetical protein